MIGMTDQMGADLREEVPPRYARTILEPQDGVAASCTGSPGR
jgi:hypothetical protein